MVLERMQEVQEDTLLEVLEVLEQAQVVLALEVVVETVMMVKVREGAEVRQEPL